MYLLTNNSATRAYVFKLLKITVVILFLIGGLGKDHEVLRRRIENGAKELWFFLQSELKKLKSLEGSDLQRRVDEFLSDLGHQERYLD